MDDATRALIRQRAGDGCEYCHLPERLASSRFQLEHVIAVQHGGSDSASNLALSCPQCNAHKGPNIAGLDPDTGRLTRLFHPRQDVWDDHFRWAGHVLVGKTDVGRTTIVVLAINDTRRRSVRAVLLFEGLFPPRGG